MTVHPIAPVFDNQSKVLILGSFPSVKSREYGFFYGHPQNRFWRVTAEIFDCNAPASIDEKRTFLLENHIALWDVIASCEIVGSSDSSIKNVTPNDISRILSASPVERIFTNGKKAFELYNKYILPEIGIEAQCLPSTSPANAAWSLERLTAEWRKIKL